MEDYAETVRMEVEKPEAEGEKEVTLVKETNGGGSGSANKENDESNSAAAPEPQKDTNNDTTTTTNDNMSITSTTDSNEEEDDDEEEDSDKDDAPSSSVNAELLLIKATTLKEEGNTFFKDKDFEKASRSYRRGVNALKPLNKGNTGDAQVKGLLLSLQNNLSMMHFKMNNFKSSLQVASNALKIDSTNVKALYRRGVAHSKLGNLEDARQDLRTALKHDSNNTAVKKELANVKKQIEQANKAQQKGLQKAFQKGGSFLYNDKEEEERRKAEEKRLKKNQEEEALKKRKVEWEDECVKRMAKGEPAVSFEDWEKERKEEAKRKQKLEEQKKKEQRKKARNAAKTKEDSDSDDDDELTEKELAQFRGYKKTADGKVTSYFTREQSQLEKNLIGDIAPKRLDSNEDATTPMAIQANGGNGSISPSSSNDAATAGSGGKGNPSAWNQAGTWEEKDTTDWCRKRLKSRLVETKVENDSIAARIVKVDNLTGDASVAIVSGKKRYIFDFHCNVEFEIFDPADDDILAKGSLQLPDICSTHHEELEVTFNGWDKNPISTTNDKKKQTIVDCQQALSSEIRESVKLWVTDFNEMY